MSNNIAEILRHASENPGVRWRVYRLLAARFLVGFFGLAGVVLLYSPLLLALGVAIAVRSASEWAAEALEGAAGPIGYRWLMGRIGKSIDRNTAELRKVKRAG